jgi:hypothetical protein
MVIYPFEIVFYIVAFAVLYIYAISILFKNKSNFIPYLALLLFPVVGAVGIIVGNIGKINKSKSKKIS